MNLFMLLFSYNVVRHELNILAQNGFSTFVTGYLDLSIW